MMQKIFYILICLMFSTAAISQQQSDIVFKTTTHSFGKVKQSVPVTYIFTFTNNASKPAIIEFANADCGCTTPEYSKDPILKGKSSNIKVTYDAATPGVFKKNIHIKFLSMQLPVDLTIDGEVVPVNAKSNAKQQ